MQFAAISSGYATTRSAGMFEERMRGRQVLVIWTLVFVLQLGASEDSIADSRNQRQNLEEIFTPVDALIRTYCDDSDFVSKIRSSSTECIEIMTSKKETCFTLIQKILPTIETELEKSNDELHLFWRSTAELFFLCIRAYSYESALDIPEL